MRSPSRPPFPELEIVATVVVKFTASPHSVFVGDCVRLWPSHYGRPFALAALEGINYRSVSLAVGNDGSHPSHSNSLSQSDASRVPAASACVMGLFPSGETTCDKVVIGWNPLWRTLLRLWAQMSGRLRHGNSSQRDRENTNAACGQGCKAHAGDSADLRSQPVSSSHAIYLRDTAHPMIPPTITPSVNVAAIVSIG